MPATHSLPQLKELEKERKMSAIANGKFWQDGSQLESLNILFIGNCERLGLQHLQQLRE